MEKHFSKNLLYVSWVLCFPSVNGEDEIEQRIQTSCFPYSCKQKRGKSFQNENEVRRKVGTY